MRKVRSYQRWPWAWIEEHPTLNESERDFLFTICALTNRKEQMSVSNISRFTGFSKHLVTRTKKSLIARGLLQQKRTGRAVILSLIPPVCYILVQDFPYKILRSRGVITEPRGPVCQAKQPARASPPWPVPNASPWIV
jgi:hypothetical protein